MRIFTLYIILIILVGCKQQESKNPINDKELLDSLKNEYKEYYKDVKDPKGYVPYIGTTEFCYDKERLKIHKILFSNTKDERLVNDNYTYGSLEKASDSLINTFSIKERLIFALVYPEYFSQTCGAYIDVNNLSDEYISTELMSGPEGYYASERQLKALEKNKDSVAIYLNSCYTDKDNLPVELYGYIAKLKLYKSIPMLIEHYNKKGNPFITATLIAMMVDDNYEPFMRSKLLKEMKGKFYKKGDSAWGLDPVEKTPERIKELLFHVQNYYQWNSQE